MHDVHPLLGMIVIALVAIVAYHMGRSAGRRIWRGW